MPRDYAALLAYLETAKRTPFAWGSNDCVTFAAGAIKAQTGLDPLAGIDPWSDEAGAEAAIEARGGLEAAVSASLSPIHPAQAQRGDVAGVTIGNQFFLMVVLGDVLVGVSETGARRLPRRMMTAAWSADPR